MILIIPVSILSVIMIILWIMTISLMVKLKRASDTEKEEIIIKRFSWGEEHPLKIKKKFRIFRIILAINIAVLLLVSIQLLVMGWLNNGLEGDSLGTTLFEISGLLIIVIFIIAAFFTMISSFLRP